MIQRLSHLNLYVLDQDSAKAFYTEKLGFEVRADVRMGDLRWLTVAPRGQHDTVIALTAIRAGVQLDDASARALRDLVKKGALATNVFETADVRKTYTELVAKGVEFPHPPEEQPYGIEALMRDDSGNWLSLVQPRT